MRVLLDEHLPLRLRHAPSADVSTVRGEGWSGTKNGVLLDLAADMGFDVVVTNDRSIEHQQNLLQVRLGRVMIGAPTNKLEDLLPLVPAIEAAIGAVAPGEVRHVAT